MKIRHIKPVFLMLLGIILLSAAPAHSAPWPAENRNQAVNLTYAAPGDIGFGVNLSGAYWNEARRELWVVRNGGNGGSKVWVLEEYLQGGTTTWIVKSRNGVRGEWANFNDLEDITFVNDNSDVVFLLIEGEERIKAYNMANYGQAVLLRNYNTRPYLPLNGGSGAEGIAFVPNSALQAIGFMADNASGQSELRLGVRGMGGLMFVGHQNGGALYVFDLDPNSNNFDYVGRYDTSYGETAALAFDRGTREMYIWHDAGFDKLEVTDLRTTRIGTQHYRLTPKRIFDRPNAPGDNTDYNYEGIAIRPVTTCGRTGVRKFFMTVDDGGANSLFMHQQFTDGCGNSVLSGGEGGVISPDGPLGGIARPGGR